MIQLVVRLLVAVSPRSPLGANLDVHELFADYPRLTLDDMKARLAYLAISRQA